MPDLLVLWRVGVSKFLAMDGRLRRRASLPYTFKVSPRMFRDNGPRIFWGFGAAGFFLLVSTFHPTWTKGFVGGLLATRLLRSRRGFIFSALFIRMLRHWHC